MSRQRKLRNKNTARQVATHEMIEDKTGKLVTGPRKKGPRSTTPKHGKVKRLPYDAEFRKKHFKLSPRHDRAGNLVY